MQDVNAPLAESVRLIFHSDDNTPVEFIVSLLQTVFAKSGREDGTSLRNSTSKVRLPAAPIRLRWRTHCSMSANGTFVRPGIPCA
jgi:hypothetical protein